MLEPELLFAEAARLGFELCGIAAPVEAPHLREYEAWIAKGYHGTMEYLARHAALKAHPENLLPGVKSVIAVGLNYHQPNPREAWKPHIAAYALGRDYHKVVRTKLKRLAAWIGARYEGAQCRPCVDSAPICERDFAHLAGLGWFGKNTMLINTRRGSWFFIGVLLTTAEFRPSTPSEGGCGTCTACIDACPTGAILFEEDRWQVDARRCISYLTIEQDGPIERDLAGWTFGCDVCQEVCPFNHPRPNAPLRALPTREPDFLAKTKWPSLEEMAGMSDEALDQLTRGSATRRAFPHRLRRNVAMGLEFQRSLKVGEVE